MNHIDALEIGALHSAVEQIAELADVPMNIQSTGHGSHELCFFGKDPGILIEHSLAITFTPMQWLFYFDSIGAVHIDATIGGLAQAKQILTTTGNLDTIDTEGSKQ